MFSTRLDVRASRWMGMLLLVGAASFLAGCGRGSEKETAEAQATPPEAAAEASSEEPQIPGSVRLTTAAIAESGIQTWKVQPVDLEHLLLLTGTVGHDENKLLQVASNVRGRVAEIPVDLGQQVRKGQPLLWIESIDLSHAWDGYVQGLTDLRVAGRAFERARALIDAKAISAGELQTREAAYQSKKVEADTLARTLRQYGESGEEIASVKAAVEANRDPFPGGAGPHKLAVRAPFAGRVIERKVTPGSLVESFQPLLTVADLSQVWVFLQAYEKDLALIEGRLPVTIRTQAFPQESFHGRVDFVSSVLDEATHTARVRATVNNPSEKLRPGMFVRAQVEVPRPVQEAHAVLVVPESALQSLEGRTHVFVRTEPGVFVRRAVETGHTFEGFTEVLSGVKSGEEVVTEGSFVVKGEFARATLAEEE